MIKVGDLVIKNTGGNKMKVTSITNGVAECVWFTESFNQGHFNLNDLTNYSEYKKLFLDQYRQDKIEKILNS
jgi:uncharacterized protein YodC (DUF2158 family)